MVSLPKMIGWPIAVCNAFRTSLRGAFVLSISTDIRSAAITALSFGDS